MIKISTDKLQGEKFEKWRKKAIKARQKLLDEWNETNCTPENFEVKIWKELKDEFLLEIHSQKCAYCENYIAAITALHVEHYRPKAGVTERENDIDHKTRKACQHPGYFWLAYEWDNLILSCPNCNSYHTNGVGGNKHPGKLNEFRVKGARVNKPSDNPENWAKELTDELPLLLHPYFDQPENEIGFDENGIPFGLTDRGRETIEVCDLARLALVEDRVHEKESYFSTVMDILKGYPKSMTEPSKKYSAWHKACVRRMIQTLAENFGYEINLIASQKENER